MNKDDKRISEDGIVIYQVDAFTDKPYSGNPAAVVLNADKLSPEQKQNFAREMNLSRAAFVSNSEKAAFKVEFFSPRKEVPICGHATIATFWLLAELEIIKPNDDYVCVTQETKQGILPVEIFWKNGQLEKVMMTQSSPAFTQPNLSKNKLANILRIREDKIEVNEKLPLTIASTGSPKLLVLITSKEMTDALAPKFDDLERLCLKLKTTGVHLYTFDTYLEGSNCYSRHFAPIEGVPEDPVSGMANGALGAYLVSKGFAQPGRLIIEQGESVERPGIVEVIIDADKKGIKSVKVGGKAKTVFKLFLEEEM